MRDSDPRSVPAPVRAAGLLLACLASAATLLANTVHAQSLVPPLDPRESIVYWQPSVIAAERDPAVAEAQRVFSILLRAWDYGRLEPALHVVDSSVGPWAASLADGNILLSRAAIDACNQFGSARAPHLLAFVLGHELAHQRADDLWHHKFFRLAGAQNASVQARLVEGLGLDARELEDIAKREARADHDGLVLMSSVGFDPYQIIDQRDFFTAWVENVWGGSCATDGAAHAPCRDAQTRALRTRVQLAEVAAQATLYDLGVQALVAGRHAEARRLLTAYGRDYPSRAVLASLGVSYLAQVLEDRRELIERGQVQAADFYYPLILDARPQATAQRPGTVRGASAALLPQRLLRLLGEANRYLERAIRLEPAHRASYLLLAVSHLLEGNPYLVRGVLQGRFAPRFGDDAGARVLLALTRSLEGDDRAAWREIESLLPALTSLPSALPREQLLYTAYHNAAVLAGAAGETARQRSLWKELAERARDDGGLLFRLAVARVTQRPAAAQTAAGEHWLVAGARPGERLADSHLAGTVFQRSDVWIDGSPMRVYRSGGGARLVVDGRGLVRHAWQVGRDGSLPRGMAIGDSADRALKVLGIPSRQWQLVSGQYLAYDDRGLAVHLLGDTIHGWFLYAAQ